MNEFTLFTLTGEGEMATFKVAHVVEQGQQMIIIPLDNSFEFKSEDERQSIVASLQACATSAGLVGTVVVIWKHRQNVRFIAPQPWHPFFKTVPYERILSGLNKELTCG